MKPHHPMHWLPSVHCTYRIRSDSSASAMSSTTHISRVVGVPQEVSTISLHRMPADRLVVHPFERLHVETAHAGGYE